MMPCITRFSFFLLRKTFHKFLYLIDFSFTKKILSEDIMTPLPHKSYVWPNWLKWVSVIEIEYRTEYLLKKTVLPTSFRDLRVSCTVKCIICYKFIKAFFISFRYDIKNNKRIHSRVICNYCLCISVSLPPTGVGD